MKLLLKKYLHLKHCFLDFFRFFFIFLMSLKLWFKSFNLLHIPFSVFLSCSCFFFFFKKKFIFLSNLPSFYFSFFNAFFNFFFLSLLVFVHKHMFRYEHFHNFEDFSPTVFFFFFLFFFFTCNF